jgi:hypothetical protein
MTEPAIAESPIVNRRGGAPVDRSNRFGEVCVFRLLKAAGPLNCHAKIRSIVESPRRTDARAGCETVYFLSTI